MVAYAWFINIANYEDWYPDETAIYSSPLKALCAGFKYGGYSLAQIGIAKYVRANEIAEWEILDVVKHAEPWFLDEEED